MSKRMKWALDICMKDAAKYSARIEWKKANKNAYQAAQSHGWLDQCCAHMSRPAPRNLKWTLERCMKDAAKYKHRKQWDKANTSAYQAARRNGWLDQCCAHMTKPRIHNLFWTLERCMEDAAKYSHRKQWGKESSGAYNAALREGWMDECCAHMEELLKPDGYWTFERCKADALLYSTKKEWREASSGAQSIAYDNDWIDECCAHMERFSGSDNDVVYVWCDEVSGIHKVGITSERLGEWRIGGRNLDMDPRIVFMLRVPDARAVESQLLKLGTDPELDSSIDGYTEFRRLTDADLGKAVSIAYEAALAA